MKIDEHIKNLEEYCQDDIEFRSQTAEEEKSDFDIFCDNHIADIEAVISELERRNKIIESMIKYIEKRGTTEDFCTVRYKKGTVNCDENCSLCIKKYFEERLCK